MELFCKILEKQTKEIFQVLKISERSNAMKPVKVKGTVIGEGIPKICVSIIGKTESDIIKEADCIKELNADIIEWRVDFFENAADINSVIDAPKR